jgi:FKBP-type peptidyl-prolyl cis-trans isomerase 2
MTPTVSDSKVENLNGSKSTMNLEVTFKGEKITVVPGNEFPFKLLHGEEYTVKAVDTAVEGKDTGTES